MNYQVNYQVERPRGFNLTCPKCGRSGVMVFPDDLSSVHCVECHRTTSVAEIAGRLDEWAAFLRWLALGRDAQPELRAGADEENHQGTAAPF